MHHLRTHRTGSRCVARAQLPRHTDRRQEYAGTLAVLVLGISLAATVVFGRLVRADGLTIAETVALFLFVPLFGSVTFNFLTSGAGFVRIMRREMSPSSRPSADGHARDTASRVALVMLVRHEVVARVHAGLRAIYRSLAETGPLEPYTIFLLSDSTDPAVGEAEECAVRALAAEFDAPGRVRYRRRAHNHGRKSGNLADFCARWGKTFDYMIVLDADSLLEGATIRELVRRMDRQPRTGILQAPTRPVNRGSLFARIHQFATSVYGPLMIEGLDFWLGRSAPYWGHNAIIRVAPFMKHCRLPRLPGREPLGGDILSHDFVEAALMRAAGWDVRLASDLGGSYEEPPANLVAHAARERRWCQGNLQHLRLVFAPRFVLASRLTLAVGAISYLCGPAWVLFVMALSARGTVPAWAGLADHAHPTGSSLDRALGATLMALTLAMLFLPKLLAVIRLSVVPRAVALRGGWRSVAASVVLEGVFAILVTPILVTFQTVFVLAILAGRNAGWGAQARGDGDIRLSTAFRVHGLQTVCGLAAGIHFYATGFLTSIWLLFSLAGLWLAIPLSIASSRVDWGTRARGWGLFLIPEEIARPRLLQALTEAFPDTTDRAWPSLAESHVRKAAA